MKKVILFLCFTALMYGTKAATIKGIVLDNTGETAIGAVVTLENTAFGTAAGLDGSFTFNNVPRGTYKLKVNLISYEPLIKEVTIKDDNETVTLNLSVLPQTKTLKEAVVVGHVSGVSDANARLLEKNSENVMNLLSGRAIELMPDVTVANVLRRVPAVTVDRGDNGEGRFPVIRGMDKRYNYTLVNGIKIPSPDDKNRYVPMDIFPSEMLQRLEVVKSLTPEMEGDAIGGAMNLVMKEAPDHLLLAAQGALGYSQMLLAQSFQTYDHGSVNKQSPAEINGANYTAVYNDFTKKNLDFKKAAPLPDGNFSITAGNRFLKDKLGIIVSANYQSTDRTTKDIFFAPNAQPNPVPYPGNQPDLSDLQLRTYYTHDDRLGTQTKIDYKINDKNSISLYGVFIQLNSFQSRFIIDSSKNERTGAGTGDVDLLYRSKTVLQSIYNATLQGKHTISRHFSLDWSGAYSIAKRESPDQAELTLTQVVRKDSAGNTIPSAPVLGGMTRIWQHNSDHDLSGYLNLHYKTIINGQKLELGAGGMYRHKDRDNFYYNYGHIIPTVQNTAFTNIYNAGFQFQTPDFGKVQTNDDTYTITENVAALYFLVKWQPTDKWDIIAGARNEITDLSYNETTEPVSFPGQTGETNYSDLLPSVSVKYKLNPKTALHLAYFKSISRPGFFEVTPYHIDGNYFTEAGNPYLLHTKADNLDVRYELFPGGSDQLLIGAFYKHLVNPIELAYERPVANASQIEPENAGNATNAGVEVVYTRYFHKFGVSLNYTYTYSDVKSTSKLYYDSLLSSGQLSPATEKTITINRPLQGQAAHIGNISLLYKDPKSGWELQVSAVYTGRHITYVSAYQGLDYWQRGNLILDFSGEKKISKHCSIYGKVNNILNTSDYIDVLYNSSFITSGNQQWPLQPRTDRILVQKRTYGQNFLFGFRYHL